MFTNTRFSSLLKGLSRKIVEKAVERNKSDKANKGFNTWNHLVSMVFAQVSGAKSLRELEEGFNSQSRHHYHLQCKEIKRSTLSDANSKRDSNVFREVCEHLITQAHNSLKSEARDLLYLIDSSPIILKGLGYDDWAFKTRIPRVQGLKLHMMIEAEGDTPVFAKITPTNVNDLTVGQGLNIEESATYVFDKGYCDYNWWYKINCTDAFFVTRFKQNAGIKIERENQILPEDKGIILGDNIVKFKCKRPGGRRINQYHGTSLRQVIVHRDDNEKPLIIATNDMSSPASEIARIYKERWAIELFFKWIKQNLKIKQFLGRSENAVKIQIYTALITYLLARIYRDQIGYSKTLKLFMVMLRSSLFLRPDSDYLIDKKRQKREKEWISRQGAFAL